ncbi:MAG TPA: ABC transporter permease subunit [Anaerolineales bacterium]|nr:ABC transporter permease subunit [Anaerolineales bacterium]
MTNIWILARMTFREAIRRRIVATGLVLGLCFLIIYSIGFHFIFGQIVRTASAVSGGSALAAVTPVANVEGANTLLLLGLYAATFLSIAMAALLAADTLSGEISSGTIQTIVTKPIRRMEIVLGKWLGFAFLLGLYLALMGGGTLLSVFLQAGYLPDHVLAGLSLIYFEALLIMTISMACSSAFSALATGGIVFGLYGLAFIGGWIEQFGAILQNPTAIKVGIIASLIIPSEALWRRAAFEMQTPLAGVLGLSPFGTVSVPSLLMIAYTAVYLLATLAAAIRVFEKRDI